jgi:hypothetical protein
MDTEQDFEELEKLYRFGSKQVFAPDGHSILAG